MFKALVATSILYTGDSIVIFVFALGIAWLFQAAIVPQMSQLLITVPERTLLRFAYYQLAIVLIALVGFKWVTITQPHTNTAAMLSKGPLVTPFGYTAVGTCGLLALAGIWKTLQLVKQWFTLKWNA